MLSGIKEEWQSIGWKYAGNQSDKKKKKALQLCNQESICGFDNKFLLKLLANTV